MNTTQRGYLAIDIESTGPKVNNMVIAIGTALGDEHGNLIEKKTFCISPPPDYHKDQSSNEEVYQFDEKCWNEFWVKNLPILKRIRDEAKPLLESLGEFIDYLDSLEKRFPGTNLIILSDNPAYDVGNLDRMLERYRLRMPIRYANRKDPRNPIYRWIEDPSGTLYNLKISNEVKELINNKVQHDHWPENDAHYIYLQYVYMVRVCNEIAKVVNLKEIVKRLE